MIHKLRLNIRQNNNNTNYNRIPTKIGAKYVYCISSIAMHDERIALIYIYQGNVPITNVQKISGQWQTN